MPVLTIYAHFQNRLDRMQQGLNPYDWKPFSTIGPGVREIRTRDADGIYRVMYVAKFEEAVTYCIVFKRKHRLPVNRILI